LADARIQGEIKKVFNLYKQVDLLILDEWLFMDITTSEARDLLEITEARYYPLEVLLILLSRLSHLKRIVTK